MKMVKFGLDGLVREMSGWAKHHKQISILYKREKENDVNETTDEKLLALIEKYPERIDKKKVMIFNRTDGKSSNAMDYYFMLDNLEYEDGDIEHYNVGASNTEQTIYVRFKFMLEYSPFILDHKFHCEGSFALNFLNFINSIEMTLEEVISEKIEEEDSLNNHGIEYDEEENEYTIVALDIMKHPIDFPISKQELFDGLVGIEVYKFDMTIH